MDQPLPEGMYYCIIVLLYYLSVLSCDAMHLCEVIMDGLIECGVSEYTPMYIMNVSIYNVKILLLALK